MQRPASRAGVALPSSIGMHAPIPVQPRTSSQPLSSIHRPPTGQSQSQMPTARPPTSSSAISTGRPPTGMRPPTSSTQHRLGTGNSTSSLTNTQVNLPVNTENLQIHARPMTSQGGLAGIRLSTSLPIYPPTTSSSSTATSSSHSQRPPSTSTSTGPRRQVADRQYYTLELRNRLRDIIDSIQSMRQQSEKLQKDETLYTEVKKKYDIEIKSIRVLEGELADMNLAMDKATTHTHVNDILAIQQSLKQQNTQRRKQLDDIYLHILEYEKTNKTLNQRIEQSQTHIEQKLQASAEKGTNGNLYERYNELSEELQQIKQYIQQRIQYNHEMDSKIQHVQDSVNTREYQIHLKGQNCIEEQKRLEQQHSTLVDELQVNSQLSVNELKEKLMKQVKEENSVLQSIEKQCASKKQETEELQEEISKEENELYDVKKFYQNAHKYDTVIEKDEAINQYLQQYETVIQTLQQEKARVEQRIIQVVKSVHDETQVDLESLQNPMIDSTHQDEDDNPMNSQVKHVEKVQEEISQVKSELTKLETTSQKITEEVKRLHEHMNKMKTEVSTYKTEEQLALEEREKKKQLMLSIQQVKREWNGVKQRVTEVSQLYDEKQKHLENSSIYKQLLGVEEKYKHVEQNVWSLEEYVKQKKRESDYLGVREGCQVIAKEINQRLMVA